MSHDNGYQDPVDLAIYRRTRERVRAREAPAAHPPSGGMSALMRELVEHHVRVAIAQHEEQHHRQERRRVALRRIVGKEQAR